MKLKTILSKRNRSHQNYAQPIIYEWEDVISDRLNLKIMPYSILYRLPNRFKFLKPIIRCLVRNSFRFVVNANDSDFPMNSKHIIPCIIDFFVREDQLKDFYERHSNNKITLLSSPFDYEYLKSKKCPIPIGLLAYSLPDKYAFRGFNVKKKYDIVLTGRQDPLLYDFFKIYIQKHPDIKYVKRGKTLENDIEKTLSYYVNGTEEIGELNSREDYFNLLSQAKVSLYGTQGYDGSGFYHVTPAFLERVAAGCHIIAHYPPGSPDALYYQMDVFSPSVETYEDFENAMDRALSNPIDRPLYETYLKKHLTSARIEDLENLIKGL